MFVTPSDFDKIEFNLPRLEQVINSFEVFVEQSERTILLQLLGVILCDRVYNGINSLPIDWVFNANGYSVGDRVVYNNSIWICQLDANTATPNEIDGTWLLEGVNVFARLKNGSDYVLGNKTFRWLGLNDLLIPFIYNRYITNDVKKYSGIGAVVAKSENSNVVPPTILLVQSWNAFIDKVYRLDAGSLYGFIASESDLYKDLVISDNDFYKVNEFDL